MLLPNLLPLSSNNKFAVIPIALLFSPLVFLIISNPVVIFPHWSEPPS